MTNKFIASAILILFISLLSACQSTTPTSQPSSPPTIQAASETPRPSSTPSPSGIPQSSPTNTLSPTPSQTVTSTSVFVDFTVQFAEYKNSGMLLTFQIPGVNQPFRLEVSGQKFTCILFDKYPGRLFCTGAEFKEGLNVDLVFYAPEGTELVYQATYIVKPLSTPTIDPKTLSSSNCPVRGINASCETENRVADNGKCIVSTCVDACGYWYSIDTCYYMTPYIDSKQLTQTAMAKP